MKRVRKFLYVCDHITLCISSQERNLKKILNQTILSSEN